MAPIRIVADSSSDLFAFDSVDFRSVPLKILTEEGEFVDKPGIDLGRLVDVLRTTEKKTSTSCPNVYEWKEAFEGAQSVFAVTITSSLSGSYAAAAEAAREYMDENPGVNVCVIDSLSTGPEMRLIVEKLAELINEDLPFEAICERVTEYIRHTHLLFALESLKNLARNGRVAPALAKITEILGIRFIGKASDEGTLQQVQVARGRKKTAAKVFAEMKSLGYRGNKLRITHCVNPETVELLKKLVLEEFPGADIVCAACTGLCSYYAEAGGILIGFEDYGALC